MTPLRIRVLRHSAFYSPLLMTIAAGFLREEGLEPHYDVATSVADLNQALLDGQVQIGQSAVATSFAALQKGEDTGIRHFAQINTRDGFFLTSRQPRPAFAWEDLMGKNVLVDHFFQPLAMLRYALYKKGIDYADIRAMDAGDVDAMDRAFRQGQGDFVHQQGPYAQQLESDGVGTVVAAVGDVIGEVAFSSLCATPQWLQTPHAARFMRAYRKGLRFAIEQSPQRLAELEATFFPEIHPRVLQHTIAQYQQLGTWSPDPVISRSAFDTTVHVFLHSKAITQSFAYDQIISAPPQD